VSAVSDPTRAQLLGVTNTSESEDRRRGQSEEPGAWSEDLETSVYGENTLAIPGMGESADRCGEWFPKQFCDGEDHHVHLGQHLCGRRTCSRCWSGQWARPRTVNVISRLGAGRYAEPEGIRRRAVHVAISPPEGDVEGPSELFRYRSKAVEKAREHGIRGGVMVAHPWRVTDDAKDEFRELEEFDGGIWRWVRENKTHWRDQVHWSPHFHAVGLSTDVKAGTGEDGWVVKNIERNGSHALEPFHITDGDGYEDMARVVRYLLSHAGVDDDGDRQAVTWFGSLHATNFDPEKELSEGAWSAIQRRSEEIVGSDGDRGEQDGDEIDEEACPVDGCDGELHPIWDVPAFIDQRGSDLSLEALTRLRTAFDWAIGDDDDEEAPQDGWPRPQSQQEAQAVSDSLLGGGVVEGAESRSEATQDRLSGHASACNGE
jgi:hypothetical protein